MIKKVKEKTSKEILKDFAFFCEQKKIPCLIDEKENIVFPWNYNIQVLVYEQYIFLLGPYFEEKGWHFDDAEYAALIMKGVYKRHKKQ